LSVAVTTTTCADEMEAGAVYRPVAGLIEPQSLSLISHIMPELGGPSALNWTVPPGCTLAEAGVTLNGIAALPVSLIPLGSAAPVNLTVSADWKRRHFRRKASIDTTVKDLSVVSFRGGQLGGLGRKKEARIDTRKLFGPSTVDRVDALKKRRAPEEARPLTSNLLRAAPYRLRRDQP
jgi:hypothetical protein